MTLSVIGLKPWHHSGFSGYHQLLNGLQFPIKYIDVSERRLPWLTGETLGGFKIKDAVFHLYGESTFRFGILAKLASVFQAATFHQPPSVLDKLYPANSLRKIGLRSLDLVTVVGKNQLEWFTDAAPKAKVVYIPHGVNLEYFHPPENSETRMDGVCLVVGNWLRDWRTLAAAVTQLEGSTNLQFNVLTQDPGAKAVLKDLPRVNLFSDVTDNQLLRLYQTAEMVVLPLKDSTANNALLEAMACGCPTIVTRVGGISDYVQSGSAVTVDAGEPFELAESIKTLHGSPDKRAELEKNARLNAEKYSWGNISVQFTAEVKNP